MHGLLDPRAEPNALGEGIVIESQYVKGLGYVATVLVQWGTFKEVYEWTV